MHLTARVLAATVAALGAVACGNQATAPSSVPENVTVITVSAQIDLLSRLRLSGNTAQWHHLEGFPPGPTTINGKEWVPTWPSDDPRDCECLSNVFSEVAPPLPSTSAEIALERFNHEGFAPDGRRFLSVVQSPDEANDFTTIVEFDSRGGGRVVWDVEIRLTES